MQAQAALERALNPERNYEIVNGQPEEKDMPGGLHGIVTMRLAVKLGAFVMANQLGEASTEANFKIGKGERIPDLSFVAAARIPAEGIPSSVWQIAPDLAIEIISPNDLHEKVNTKVLEYLDAGVKQVWVVSLEQRMVTIYHAPNESHFVRGDAELTGGDLLPGFRCQLNEIFPAVSAPAQS